MCMYFICGSCYTVSEGRQIMDRIKIGKFIVKCRKEKN